MPVAIDKPVPDFTAPATSGKEVTLSALKGKQVVLYFYPKDSTPGCTTEGQGFRDQYAAFQKANTEVFGISLSVRAFSVFIGNGIYGYQNDFWYN